MIRIIEADGLTKEVSKKRRKVSTYSLVIEKRRNVHVPSGFNSRDTFVFVCIVFPYFPIHSPFFPKGWSLSDVYQNSVISVF